MASRVRIYVYDRLGPFVMALIAIVIAAIFTDYLALAFTGIKKIATWFDHATLVAGYEMMVVMTVANESILNGFTSASEMWHKYATRLLFLITVGVGIRMLFATSGAWVARIPHPEIVGANNTATDPVAIILIIAVLATLLRIPIVREFAWVMAMDSVANDAVSRVVFGAITGVGLKELAISVLTSIGLAMFLAVSDWFVRRWIRDQSPFRDRKAEGYVEVLVMPALYFGFGILSYYMGAGPILVGVLGGIVGDYFVHGLRTEVRHPEIVKLRQNLYGLWAVIGLLVAVYAIVTSVPFGEITPIMLAKGLVVVGPALFFGRYVTEMLLSWLFPEQFQDKMFARAASILAMTLLGVPSVGAAHIYVHDDPELAYQLYAIILDSWLISIPLSIVYMVRLYNHLWGRLTSEERQLLMEAPAPVH